MTSLEQTLANLLDSIERARSAGNSHLLKALLHRKHVISGVLAAPEQSWVEPQVQVSTQVRRPVENTERVRTPALCD